MTNGATQDGMEPAPYRQPGTQSDLVAEPNAGLPRTIGTLNIVFASIILACGICMAIQSSVTVAMGPAMKQFQADAKKSITEQHESRIEELRQQEEAATTDDEKAILQRQREDLEKQGPPQFPDTSAMFSLPTQVPFFMAYSLVDYGTGVVMNVVMLISGIGLVRYREWGRRLALWVAGIKIVRLVCVELFFIIVIVPAMSRKLGETFEGIMKMNPGGGPPPPIGGGQMGMIYAAMYTAMGIAMLVLGVIYPIVVLWFLTRPGVRAACQGPVSVRQV